MSSYSWPCSLVIIRCAVDDNAEVFENVAKTIGKWSCSLRLKVIKEFWVFYFMVQLGTLKEPDSKRKAILFWTAWSTGNILSLWGITYECLGHSEDRQMVCIVLYICRMLDMGAFWIWISIWAYCEEVGSACPWSVQLSLIIVGLKNIQVSISNKAGGIKVLNSELVKDITT